jgi:choline dehydrogenase-like flavoprotein
MKSVVVIGSGLAGSLISNELARDCRVTLLEAGRRDRITYPEVEFVNKDFGVVKTFCIGGGTTNLWHNKKRGQAKYA